MQQKVKSETTFEFRRQINETEWQCWMRATGGMYIEAILLAYRGRLVEAIEEAEKVHLQNYGNMHGIEFRCVTKSTTITTL